jgi:site-specific recombinase XerD
MTTILETLPDFFFHLQHNRCVTPGTMLTYKNTMKQFCNLYGLKETKELLPTHIQRFKMQLAAKTRQRRDGNGNKKKMCESYVTNTMIRIKSYIKRLSERCYLNKLKPSDIPVNKTILYNPAYLTKTEIKQVMNYLEIWVESVETESRICKRDRKYPAYMARALVWMLYATGLRNMEIRSLKMQDIDMEKMTGTVLGKGGKYGFFTFNEPAREKLVAYLAKRQEYYPQRKFRYLFSSANKDRGKPITDAGVNMLLCKIGQKAGIAKRLHAHVFRHTCATHLLDAGANIREVQEKLRHVNLDTTAIYTHVSNNRLSEITKGLAV